MRIKRLVAFGCSHTYGEGLPDCIPPVELNKMPPTSKFAWPEILANKLSVECLNKSKCGISNKNISEIVLDAPLQKDDIVVILWTSILRTCFFTSNDPIKVIPAYASKEFINIHKTREHLEAHKFNLKYYREFYFQENLEHESLQVIDHTKRYLDDKGIKNYHFNFQRKGGHDPIDSLLPKTKPYWFEVPCTTLKIIHDYAADNHHPGVKAQQQLAIQAYKTIVS